MSDIGKMVGDFAASLSAAQAEAITQFVKQLSVQNGSAVAMQQALDMLAAAVAEQNGYLDQILRMKASDEAEDDAEEEDPTEMICAALKAMPPPQVTAQFASPAITVNVPPTQVTVMPAEFSGYEARVMARDGNGAIQTVRFTRL